MTAERRGTLFLVGAALLYSTGGLGIKAIDAPPLTVADDGHEEGLRLIDYLPPGATSRRGILLEAGWHDPGALPRTPGRGSVAWRLIHGEW